MTARGALAKIHIAKKELRLDDDTYRAMLTRLTGKASSRDCTDAQLAVVLDKMKAKGWKPRVVAGGKAKAAPRSRSVAADHPSAKKARALWLSLWNLGEVDDPSEAALEAMARRQLKVERLQWADQAMTYKLIEALKAWAERAGWSQDTTGHPKGTDLVMVLKTGLLIAQEQCLANRDLTRLELQKVCGTAPAAVDAAISHNGRMIRARLGAAG